MQIELSITIIKFAFDVLYIVYAITYKSSIYKMKYDFMNIKMENISA